jgi:hypothetical protein
VESLVLLEISLHMASYFPKNTALTLFCLFREAERSVHYALSCPSQWSQFVAYYNQPKQIQISEMIGMLNAAGAVKDKVPNRQALARSDFSSFVRCIARLLSNPLKRSWAFSVRETSFLSATLGHVSILLNSAEPPEKEELIELRLDCFVCHDLISRKLFGIPELRKADSIEHFNQSEYVSHVKWRGSGLVFGLREVGAVKRVSN